MALEPLLWNPTLGPHIPTRRLERRHLFDRCLRSKVLRRESPFVFSVWTNVDKGRQPLHWSKCLCIERVLGCRYSFNDVHLAPAWFQDQEKTFLKPQVRFRFRAKRGHLRTL